MSLRGSVPIDPNCHDFFRKVIEERKSLGSRSMSEEEKTRLDKALKCTANAGSYGIFAEMNRDEAAGGKVGPEAWDVSGKVFQTEAKTPFEKPGAFCRTPSNSPA